MIKQLVLIILALSFSIQIFAQDPAAQKYSTQISTKHARKHLTILASDEFEGRETGKPGADKAANYIAKEFKKLRLTPPVDGSYFQNIPLTANSFEVKSFTINGTNLTYGKDFYFAANPRKTNIKADNIVFIGYGIDSEAYSDIKNIDLTDKVVLLINQGEPTNNDVSAVTKTKQESEWSTNLIKRIQYILGKNPSLILAVRDDIASILERNSSYFKQSEGQLSLKTTNEEDLENSKLAPIVNIPISVANLFLKNSGKSYESLKNTIDNTSIAQTQNVKVDFTSDFGISTKAVKAMNVLGFLEGSDLKEEVLVISAHYDHIGVNAEGADKINNGADDDGSGTTAILEIAKAFAKAKKQGKGPRRSILFLSVSGEEKGLLGSEWYSENPIFPLKNTIADLNIDMIGRVDPEHENNPNYCYLIGSDKLSSDLHKISENANAVYTKLNLDYKYNDPKDPNRFYYRSDHYNFAKHNIPIIFYFNGVHADYHQPSDEVSKINFDLLVKRAQLTFFTSWDLANRNHRPVVDVKNDMPADR